MTRHNARIKLKGCSFKNRPEILLWLRAHPDTPAWIEREPDCPHDPNAIRIMIRKDGKPSCVGYVAREQAAVFAPLLDNGMLIAVDRLLVIGGYAHKSIGCLADITWLTPQ